MCRGVLIISALVIFVAVQVVALRLGDMPEELRR